MHFHTALTLLSIPVVVWTTYLALLAACSGAVRGRRGERAPGEGPAPTTRFDVVVPAHDEEAGIAETVRSLLATDYPAARRRVVVVADNCTDATAREAAAAGALVYERTDPGRRGKGYALAYAFEHILAEGTADAVVVVDADTVVSPNLLRAFASRLEEGARAVQAHYGVANRRASWRTRLMHIAFTLFHDVRSRARERLGLSAGLRGNGMAFAVETLREVPHDAFSIVEDVEYGIRLGRRGHRVHYAGEAVVLGQMVSSERASRSQRTRWEAGRGALLRAHGVALLRQGLRDRSPMVLDLAMDLLVPPLSYVAAATAVGLAAAVLAVAVGHAPCWSIGPWALAAIALAGYVARGVWLAGVGLEGLLDLAWAPVYVLWKMALALRPSSARKGEWVRTAREGGEKR